MVPWASHLILAELLRLFLENIHEQPADDLALLFGIGDAGQRGQKPLLGVHPHHPHAQMPAEGGHHLIAFMEPQQAVIHEHAGQLRADGSMQQRRHHRGIHAAGQAQQHLIVADLGADGGDAVLDDVAGGPQRLAAAEVQHEPPQNALALPGVGHFGMELQPVPAPVLVGDAGDRAGGGAGDAGKPRRQGRHPVAVAHPDIQQGMAFGIRMILDVAQQGGVGVSADLGIAELTMSGRLHPSSQLRGHGLQAIANAEQRNPEIVDDLGGARTVDHRGGFRTAGQNNPARAERM
jgi:hypothetical protein